MKSEIDVSRLFLCLVGALVATGLAACETLGDTPPTIQAADGAPVALPPPVPVDLPYFPSSEPLQLALQHFHRGNYGLAERYFRDVVEKDPRNITAWLGLAGSYDHIRRFDLADRAYRMAIQLGGETPQILNNYGYSYILRSKFEIARKYIMKAYALDPGDPTIVNNLLLLDSLTPPRGGPNPQGRSQGSAGVAVEV
jgi:tetratricopeptide (TPR) repeat protein